MADDEIYQAEGIDARSIHCHFCGYYGPPRCESEITTAGLILAIVLFLMLCWPLFWIGFFLREDRVYCGKCNMRLN